MEWNNYFGDDNNIVHDMDLMTTFESNADEEKFLCEVSYLDRHCGGVQFHGDNIKAKHSKTTEAITFHTIARYDYLIYINRFVSKASQLTAG